MRPKTAEQYGKERVPGPGAYDQGDMGGYNNFESGPPQDTYYQNGSYGSGPPDQYGGPDPSGGYDQGYGDYEGALELSCPTSEEATASFGP